MEPESSMALSTDVLGDRVRRIDGGSIERFMNQVREQAHEVVEFKRQWEEYEEAMVSLRETVKEHVVEVKKKEEESDLKQSMEADVMRLVLEMETEEVVSQCKDSLRKRHEELKKEFQVKKDELEERDKEIKKKEEDLRLFDETLKWKATELEKRKLTQEGEAREIEEKRKSLEVREKSFEEQMRELEVRDMDLSLFDETITEKATELEKRKEKQEAEAREIEVKRKLVEVKEKNIEEVMREIEEKQKELSLFDETIKGKVTELEKMKLKQEAEARETELKRKSLEAKEKKLKEREKVLERKEKGSSRQGKSRKRSRDEFDPASASTSQAKGREIYEVECIDDDEDPEPYSCPDADFNNFNNTMSSFSVGQIWALYDPLDQMPRYYARIRKLLEPQQKVQVRWLESRQARENEKPIPIACGEFKYGEKTISNHSMFSHLMHHTRTSTMDFTINPRKGETWALFSDWNKDTDMKRPYRYDFVQVLTDLDSVEGIGVACLGRVEGFTSVYQLAEQNLVLQMMIPSDEMLRFSHRVPSFVLTGDEKKGVPAGSFELDPAAIPRDCLEALNVKQERV